MPLILTDEELQRAGITEREARIELACRFFDAGTLHLWPAAQLAGLSRADFQAELLARGLSIMRFADGDFERDMEALNEMGV